MNRLAMGTLAIAAMGILATGCKATVTGSATPGNGTSTPVTAAPADGGNGGNGGNAGNGGGTTTSHPAPGHPTTGGTTTTPRCHSADLRATVTGYDAGAGQRYARLVLQNTSGHACRMYGFAGLQLGTASEGFGSNTSRDGGFNAPFVIIPNGHAHATLHWTVVPATDETNTPCEPVATVLQVIPPNETVPVVANWGGGEVCQHQHLSVTSFAAGPGA